MSGPTWAAVWFQALREQPGEQVDVEEGLVGLAGDLPVPRMLRPGLDGDVLGDLEAEQEVRRCRLEEPRPVVGRGELVEREVAADGGERLRVFGEAGVLELLLRVLAAR